MADKLRMVLVGCGGMMGGHVKSGLKALREAGYKDFDIVACCDVVEANAAKLADEVLAWQGTKPKLYTSVQALLADEKDYDAASVVVPHSEHHTVGVPFMEAKKHLLIEKPLAMTMRAGKKLLDAAKANRVVLSVAENYRRSSTHRALNWVVRSGRIGKPRHFHWLDVKERLWHWGWRDDLAKAGGGWTFDGGVHYADLMRYHLGPIARVTALTRQYVNQRYRDRDNKREYVPATIEDTTMALLEFENGATGVWSECISAPGEGVGRQIIHGEEGSLDFGQGLRLRGQEQPTSIEALKKEYMDQVSAEEKARFFPFGLDNPLAQENYEFVEACLRGGSVETDGLEGYKAQAVCMAVYESAALGSRAVDLKKVEKLKTEKYQGALNAMIGL
jgi:predicted dehydrogenase